METNTNDTEAKQPASAGCHPTPCSLPIIPLAESTAPTQAGNFSCLTVKLSGDREVMVGYMESGERIIRIRRPEPDGGTCETKFGMTADSAYALGYLLSKSFRALPYKEENSQDQP